MNIWSSFWDIIWWFVWAFVFISYLFALFAIITDLFRDQQLNGWWKAVWLIFLVFLPFLTALAYLITRGRGMAERSGREGRARQEQVDSYIRHAAGHSPSEEIARAKALLESGVITEAEFASLKAKALA